MTEKEKAKDKKIREAILNGLINCRDALDLGWSNFGGIHIDDCIAWLEKQDEQEQLYIRFGEIPIDEKSKIYRREIEVGIENGVSVYPAFKTNKGDIVLGLNLPITKTTLHTQQHLIEYDNKPCYLVKGDYIGKDIDGQPLINNVSIIEKIDNYRVKENIDNQNYIKPINMNKSKFLEGNWLEKQGEQEEPQVCETKDGKIITYSETDEYKFVEPNFHEGDWVVYNNDICQIVKREEGCNKLVTIFGIEKELVNEKNLSTARLWTIQDAKEGDILCYKDEISIYKHDIKNCTKQETKFGGFVYYYCYDGKRFITDSFYSLTKQDETYIHPATKEQRDVLMKAMNDAGYEWDIEKKELKKNIKI